MDRLRGPLEVAPQQPESCRTPTRVLRGHGCTPGRLPTEPSRSTNASRPHRCAPLRRTREPTIRLASHWEEEVERSAQAAKAIRRRGPPPGALLLTPSQSEAPGLSPGPSG